VLGKIEEPADVENKTEPLAVELTARDELVAPTARALGRLASESARATTTSGINNSIVVGLGEIMLSNTAHSDSSTEVSCLYNHVEFGLLSPFVDYGVSNGRTC